MRTMVAIFVMMAMIAASGCGGGTNVSPQGGIESKDEAFSIVVPTPNIVKQGSGTTITISLKRGAYFKRDVILDLASEGISVTPPSRLIKASEVASAEFQIVVANDAAIGEYKVSVKGTPRIGETTSTEFIVKVIAQ